MNTVYKVGVYDLNLSLICTKSFLLKSDADRYAKALRGAFMPHVGEIKVEPANVS